ncbi:MAG: cadmium-translocating P-type ATPase [Thermomicrobiales bacterium]|nr:cadmium-translocating P-type ATPase [Thermomicrobiales bacterium]
MSATTTFPVRGLDCASCAQTLAAGLQATPGVVDASVNFGAGTARVAYDPATIDPLRIAARVRSFGYDADPPVAAAPERFTVSGLDCADCARTVEAAVAGLPGIEAATVDFGSGVLRVTPEAAAPLDAAAVIAAVARAGYRAAPRTAERFDTDRTWLNRRTATVAGAALLWLTATVMAWLGAASLAADIVFAAAIALAGWPFARASLQALRARRLDMNVLMTVSVIGAALLGDWSEGAMVVILFAVGGALQSATLDRTRGAIRALMNLSPPTASLVGPDGETIVPVAALRVGDRVRVRPGERIAADGEIVEGSSTVDQSAITGESLPIDKESGDAVFAGTVNGHGGLVVQVTRPAEDSTLARIIHLVEEAQGSRAPSQALIDRFAAVYTPAVIALAAAIALVGGVAFTNPDVWVYRALVLLVIACPCALVISTPVSIVSAIGASTRRGVLVKGGAALETAGAARVVAFDKTGTLTTGKPSVVAVAALNAGDEREVIRLAAAVEALSEHPLARAIVAHAREVGIASPAATGFAALPGRGAHALVAGRTVAIGSANWATAVGALPERSALAAWIAWSAAAGQTPSVVAVAEEPGGALRAIGAIALADTVRPGAAEAIARLRAAGIERIVVITGDHAKTAAAVAAAVGADEAIADVLPEGKAAAVAALQARYGPVVMVGDGVNDAPALAVAAVGIAMGGGGTDVALETADMALMRDDLTAIADVLLLSRRTTGVIRQNIALAVGVKVLALALASVGLVGLWGAVLADTGTSLVVTLNGMRLARPGRLNGQRDSATPTAPPVPIPASPPAAAD